MYLRSVESSIIEQLAYFPVIAILGPRQSGKTTLAKNIMKRYDGAIYLDLESPSDLRKLDNPELYLDSHQGSLIVIDEVQHRPDLFAVLRSFVDRTERKSPLIILGSASQNLIRQGGESLAGRIALTELTPLTLPEITDRPIMDIWFRGGFPNSIVAPSLKLSVQWREQYLRSIVERDIPQLGLAMSAATLHRLLLLLAHNHATMVNLSKTGELFGISHTQMRKYLDFLCNAFLLRTIVPFENNTGKQVVKTPRVYYRDSGLLHTVLSIDSPDALLGHTCLGESWEGFVIEQILASIGSRWRASFYRTHKGAELDLVLERGEHRIGIECKVSTAPSVTRGFWSALEDLGIPFEKSWIVAPIDERYPFKNGANIAGIRQIIQYLCSLEN